MSTLVEFFVARDDASAALALDAGPAPEAESLSYGNFDPEEAVIAWECLLVGGDFEELVEAGEPRVVAEGPGGEKFVVGLSRPLLTALAGAGRSRLREVAASWSAAVA